MVSDFAHGREAPLEALTAPSAEVWATMTPEAKLAFMTAAGQRLAEIAQTMGEGRPHSTAKARVMDVLRGHFDRLGRRIYVASELPVVYPGQPTFAPDILAVLDDNPGELDRRMAWSVADEGRGIDFVLEVLHGGESEEETGRQRPLLRQARHPRVLGVYDRARRARDWLSARPGSVTATLPQSLGRVPSQVLEA